MEIRMAQEQDYPQLAEMKWLHCEEDDRDYREETLVGADRDLFIAEFEKFLDEHKEYRIFVAGDGEMIASAMFVYMIPKTPKPNRAGRYIAYLTNVYTREEYRNKGIGTDLLAYIKDYLRKETCELLFVWPSDNSVAWYTRNGFSGENDILECEVGE